jgi:hypothetical protein
VKCYRIDFSVIVLSWRCYIKEIINIIIHGKSLSNIIKQHKDIREKIINETTVSSRAWYLGEEMVFWDCKLFVH